MYFIFFQVFYMRKKDRKNESHIKGAGCPQVIHSRREQVNIPWEKMTKHPSVAENCSRKKEFLTTFFDENNPKETNKRN